MRLITPIFKFSFIYAAGINSSTEMEVLKFVASANESLNKFRSAF